MAESSKVQTSSLLLSSSYRDTVCVRQSFANVRRYLARVDVLAAELPDAMLPAVTEVDPERDEIKIEPKRDCPFEAGSDVLIAAEEDTKGDGSRDQNEDEDAFHLVSGAKLLRIRIRALDPAELKEERSVSYSRH